MTAPTEPPQPLASFGPPPGRSRWPLLAVLLCLGLGLSAGLLLHTGAPEPAETGEAGAVPVSGPPTAAEAIRVRIESAPEGASLFLDGRLLGATPLTLEGLPRGTYGLRLEREGHEAKCARLVVGEHPVVMRETLEPLATGVLEVNLQPRGAEVLLDGELAGLTPLKLDRVPAGHYELVVRMTNRESYATRLELAPGQPRVFSGFELRDKFLKMLENQIATEPQRVAHYIDLAHYHFVNNRMDQAVEIYMKAQEMAELPLDFTAEDMGGASKPAPEKEHALLPEPKVELGPNLPPPPKTKVELGPEERALEQRLRNDDRLRLKKEIDKHKNPSYWPTRQAEATAFKEKFEQAQELYSRKNMGSWTWVEMAAKGLVNSNNLIQAEQLYLGHLKAAPGGPHVLECSLELLKVRLKMRNLSTVGETFTGLYALAADRPDQLLLAGQAVMSYLDRARPADRAELLEMAEKAFRRALETSKVNALSADAAGELANTLVEQKHPVEALAYFEKALAGALSADAKDTRSLALASAFLQAGRLDDAQALYLKLSRSDRIVTRTRAEAGLIQVKAARK